MDNLSRILVSLLVVLHFIGNAQDEWYNSFSGQGNQTLVKAAKDELGNWLLTGYFSVTFDADPGSGETILTSAGLNDIYIIKLNNVGEFIWAKRFGGVRSDVPTDLEVDQNGNIILVGTFQASINFNTEADPVEFTLFGGNSSSMRESFMVKLDPNGNYVDAYHFRSTATLCSNQINALEIDNENNLVMAGYFDGAMDIDPTGNNKIISAIPSSSDDIFILKFSNVDTLLWGFRMGNIENDAANGLTLDEFDNLYITGHFRVGMDFDPGDDTLFIPTTGGDVFDIFIMSLNPDGELRWAKGIGTDGAQFGDRIVCTENDEVYVSGRFSNSVNFNPGGAIEMIHTATASTNSFLVKLNKQGEVHWAKSWSFTGIFPLAVGSDGRVLVSNFFSNTIDANPNEEVFNLASNGGIDFLVISLNPEGEFIEAFSRGGNGDEYPRFVQLEDQYFVIGGETSAAFHLNPPFESSAVEVPGFKSSFFSRFIPSTLTSIMDINEVSIIVFPNPAKDFIQIKSEVIIDLVELYDVQGRKLISIYTPQENLIYLNHVESGIYFVRFQIQNDSFIREIIIY